MNCSFRRAEKKDFSRINELFEEMLETIYQTDKVAGYPEGALDRFFAGKDEWISIATDKGQIVAFLSIEVHHEAEEFIYLDDFSVTQQYRNRGIGKTMIHIAESYAKEIHIPVIRLHVEKSNAAAMRLYERLGYHVHEDQESRYLMVKTIPTARKEKNI